MAATVSTQKTTTTCPDCGKTIAFKGRPELGRRFLCIYCGTELRVVKTDPVVLSPAYRVN